ncbi:MAG: hypothetical protein OHK005_14520 [Candidatus Methylacidiphilales bacterium]
MRRELSDEAICVRKFRFSESSWIVWWLTRNHGIVHTLAGGRRKNPTPSTQPDLFYEAEITWVHGRGDGLAQLREVQVRFVFPGLRGGFARLAAASYFAEAIARSVEHQSSVPDLFALLEKALVYLDQHEPTLHLVERFERRLFGSLGIDDGTQPLNQVRSMVFHPLPPSYGVLRQALAIEPFGDGSNG